jgi:hypothetical protein
MKPAFRIRRRNFRTGWLVSYRTVNSLIAHFDSLHARAKLAEGKLQRIVEYIGAPQPPPVEHVQASPLTRH